MYNEIAMESHGLTQQSNIVYCQTLDLMEEEYIAAVGFGFNAIDIIQVVFKTNEEMFGAYGGIVDGVVQTPLA